MRFHAATAACSPLLSVVLARICIRVRLCAYAMMAQFNVYLFSKRRFFQNSCQNKPETLWTDRGKGFYQPSNGCITGGFKQALREHKFKAIHGDDASAQPGRLQEVMLHETAVSWMRHRLARSVPAKPWEETREQYSSRLEQVVAEINETLDVEGLCRALPKRIEDLVATRGDRLSY